MIFLVASEIEDKLINGKRDKFYCEFGKVELIKIRKIFEHKYSAPRIIEYEEIEICEKCRNKNIKYYKKGEK